MTTPVAGILLSLSVAGVFSSATPADEWTSPKEVARSAKEFAGAAEKLQKAIREVDAESPLVAEVGSLSKSTAKLGDSVDKGASYEDAKKDFVKVESGYAAFGSNLKKAHDVHHEKPVADAVKKVNAAWEQLQNHMSGKRPTDKTEGASPRLLQENDR